MTYAQATANLPADAQWSCSFGNPGEGGYVEYHRDSKGRRHEISNGRWNEGGNAWTYRLEA